MDTLKEQLDFVQSVLKYMEPWTLDESSDTCRALARHPQKPEAGLIFRLRDNRFYICGLYPRDFAPYFDTLNISVSAKRTPESIAKDIYRRFLPQYLETFAESMARKEAKEKALAYTNSVLDDLGRIVGRAPTYAEVNREGKLYLSRGDLRIHTSLEPKFLFNLHGITEDQAREICRILAGLS